MQSFDLIVMIVVALSCLPIFFTGHRIERWEGALFFFYFVAYTAFLLLAAKTHDVLDHDVLDHFGMAMKAVVLPLTFTTLAVVTVREWRERYR